MAIAGPTKATGSNTMSRLTSQRKDMRFSWKPRMTLSSSLYVVVGWQLQPSPVLAFVSRAPHLLRVFTTSARFSTSCLNYLCSLSGIFYSRRRGTRVSCRKRSGALRNQLICHWSRHRSSLFRTAFGSVWPKYCLSCVIHSVFHLHIPGCFCT